MSAVWKPVVGFDGYEVSSDGRMRTFWRQRNLGSGIEWFISDISRELRSQIDHARYGHRYVSLSRDGKKHNRIVARLVLLAHVGPPPPGDYEAAHWDGNPTNDTVENLRWATPKENAADRERHGMTARGERSGSRLHPERLARGDRHGARLHPERLSRGDRHYNAKIDGPESIRAILASTARGESGRALAAKYGVIVTTISAITTRRNWAHVPWTPEDHDAAIGGQVETAA